MVILDARETLLVDHAQQLAPVLCRRSGLRRLLQPGYGVLPDTLRAELSPFFEEERPDAQFFLTEERTKIG